MTLSIARRLSSYDQEAIVIAKKTPQTHAKREREQAKRERRERKEAKKAARASDAAPTVDEPAADVDPSAE